jgi:hypothetical protein
MKALCQVISVCTATLLFTLGFAGPPADPQDTGKPQIAVDPQTGRAVGAQEMMPDELRKLIEQKAKTIIIDVRDDAQFEKETIKGAIHIPFADLEARLKEIPKDTILVFT